MGKFIITTESSADLSKDWLERYQIRTVPFSVNFPDYTVYDNEIPVQEIYDYYEKTKQIPKTNAVNPYQYTEFFEQIAKEQPDSAIIHIGYSSACSCSFQNAIIGKQECENANVYLIDSLNVSGGLGNLVLKAAQTAKDYPEVTPEQLVERIQSYVKKTFTSFVPNKLDFLLAGGRVSNAAALSAAIFRIKPRIDIIDGKLIASKKYIGTMKRIIPDFVKDFCTGRRFDKSRVYLFYSQGAEPEVMDQLKECLHKNGFETIVILQLGCVMTIHGGKAAVGISATAI